MSERRSRDGDLVARERIYLSDDDRQQLDRLYGPLGEVHEFFSRRLHAAAETQISKITYLSDGLRVNGWLLEPECRSTQPLPCIIVNRGGNRDFGAWTRLEVFTYLLTLANRGYVVVASNYRGAAEGEGQDEFGGNDVHDVLNLVPLLENLDNADTSRLGMIGLSRGGLMTYLALAHTDKVRAAVVVSGVSSLMSWERQRPDMAGVFAELLGGSSSEVPDKFYERSPVLWAQRLCKCTPLLLLHGCADRRVDPRQALDMARTLLECRHPFRLVMFEGAGHSLIEVWSEQMELTGKWLDRYVRHEGALPDCEPHDP